MPVVSQRGTPPQDNRQPVHFPGLNALRFLAAALVALVHVEDVKRGLGLAPIMPVTDDMAGLAVTFFFVLSGFLITYLLLQEKGHYGTIRIKDFYWRRALRIWPLYYIIVFIAFSILNNPTILPAIADSAVYKFAPTNIKLHLLLLPNVAYVLGVPITYANQLWSIGVEEQFYLIWPVLLKYMGRRGQLYMMVAVVIGFIVTLNGIVLVLNNYPGFSNYRAILLYAVPLLAATRISCMAIGGLGAYAFYFYPEITRRWISSWLVDGIVVALVIGFAVANIFIPYVKHEFFAVLFCYIILSSSCKPKSILQLEGRRWTWLGNISFGIYMWHLIVAAGLIGIIKAGIVTGEKQVNVLLYSTMIPLTVVISWLSYNYLEKPFLLMKKRFTRAQSSRI